MTLEKAKQIKIGDIVIPKKEPIYKYIVTDIKIKSDCANLHEYYIFYGKSLKFNHDVKYNHKELMQ